MAIPDLSVFRNKRILVVGDAMLDVFMRTASTRQSPEYPDAPVYAVVGKHAYAGGAANVAMNLKSLGALPYLVSVTGNDANGEMLGQMLHDAGISRAYLFADSTRLTTVKTRVINEGLPAFRIDEEISTDITELAAQFVQKHVQQAITDHNPQGIILQDYNKGVLNPQTIPAILELAAKHQLPVAVDPKYDNWELYQGVGLFKPNRKEFEVIGETLTAGKSTMAGIAKALQEKIRFKNLLVTLGAKGNFGYGADGSHVELQTPNVPDADVCGAGDAVIAAATLGLVCGFTLPEIAELANRAGYIACTKKHIQPVFLKEINV